MRVTRLLTCAVTTAFVVAGSVLVTAPPAVARPGISSCPSGVPVSGIVSGTAVDAGADDWYYNEFPLPTARTFTLTSSNGEAGLMVFGDDCTTVLCSSAAGETTTDVCTATGAGRMYVRVYDPFLASGWKYTLSGPVSATILSNPTDYPSDDCTIGTTLAEGFAGGNYVRVRATSAGASETWICARGEGPGLSIGGKFVVTGAGFTVPGPPSTDTNVGACASTGGNTVPGPHPALKGQLGDPSDPSTHVPFLLDSWAGNGDAWVCIGIGGVNVRAKVSTGASVPTPSVAFLQDAPGSHTAEPPILPVPSAQCQAAPSDVTRVTDVTSAGLRTYLYTWQATPSVLKMCVRTSGLVTAGGVITIDTTNQNGALPSVTPAFSITGCTLSVARLEQPTFVEVRRSGASLPASACVTVGTTTVRVTVATGNGQPPASVTWTPDAGTP